jgi:hypothetical protein
VAKNRANNLDQHRANKTDQQSSMDLKVVARGLQMNGQHFKEIHTESRQHALAIKRSQTSISISLEKH